MIHKKRSTKGGNLLEAGERQGGTEARSGRQEGEGREARRQRGREMGKPGGKEAGKHGCKEAKMQEARIHRTARASDI